MQTGAQVALSGRATLTSDYLFRGASQTLSSPALQLELGLQFGESWYAYAWGSNVDFAPKGTPDDGASFEGNLGLFYSRALNDRLSFSAGALQSIYPGTEPDYDYDYLEWQGSLELDARHILSFAYSSSVFGSGADGTFLAFSSSQRLRQQVELQYTLGYYDFAASYSRPYAYAELAISGSLAKTAWRFGYVWVDSRATDLFYQSTVDDRWVVSVELPF